MSFTNSGIVIGLRRRGRLLSRPGARHSADFEGLAGWLAQRTDKTSVVRGRIPQFTICLDPLRVITWADEAIDAVHAAEAHRIPLGLGLPSRRRWRHTAVELGLPHSRLEGINAKIRLIQHRGYDHRSLDSVTSMIYLCRGGITIALSGSRS